MPVVVPKSNRLNQLLPVIVNPPDPIPVNIKLGELVEEPPVVPYTTVLATAISDEKFCVPVKV